MGAYIHPIGAKAEDFLSERGQEITLKQAKAHNDFGDKFLVVLVDNHIFKAAGIAFNKSEKEVFLDDWEQRPRKYYIVDKSQLLKVSNLAEYLK